MRISSEQNLIDKAIGIKDDRGSLIARIVAFAF